MLFNYEKSRSMIIEYLDKLKNRRLKRFLFLESFWKIDSTSIRDLLAIKRSKKRCFCKMTRETRN